MGRGAEIVMSYDDLRIAIRRRKHLASDVRLEMEEIVFKLCSIDKKVEVKLPEYAVELDDVFLEKKYRGAYESIVAMEMPGKEADFVFCFSNVESCTPETAKTWRDSMKSIVMRLQPANAFHSEGIEHIENINAAWFDFDSFGLDGMIYNLLFFVPLFIQGRLLYGSFHCKEKQALSWKPVFLEIIQSLRELEVTDESRNV